MNELIQFLEHVVNQAASLKVSTREDLLRLEGEHNMAVAILAKVKELNSVGQEASGTDDSKSVSEA